MSRTLSVEGRLPRALARVLAESGFEIGEDEPLVLVVDDDVNTVMRMVETGRLPVAVSAGQSSTLDLLAAGAVEVIEPPFHSTSIRRTLDPLLRVSNLWRRRQGTRKEQNDLAASLLHGNPDFLGRLLDATPNAVMGADNEGRVLVYNRAAERAVGYDAAWVREHMHVSDIYADPGDARRVLSAIRNSPDGFVHELEVRLRARSGEHVPVALSAAEVYGEDGLPMATVGVFQDRRTEFHLRSRLEETTEQLIQSEQRAAASEAVRATAHELNQPLTTAMGSLELLGMGQELSDKQRQRVDRAYAQLERMAEVVRAMARSTPASSHGSGHSSRILSLPSDLDI